MSIISDSETNTQNHVVVKQNTNVEMSKVKDDENVITHNNNMESTNQQNIQFHKLEQLEIISEACIEIDNLGISPVVNRRITQSQKLQNNTDDTPQAKLTAKQRGSIRFAFQSSSTMVLEDQYFVEDQEHKEQENFNKYANDITKLKSYNMPFRFSQFFEFFLYHFVYFSLLGPATILLTHFRGKSLGRNLQFIGLGRAFYIQITNYTITIITLFFYFYFKNPTISQTIYLFNLYGVILLRCLQIATKYATFDPLKIRIYKERDIKRTDLWFDLFLADWSAQSDKIVYEQLYYTQRFFDTDPNLFYVQFMIEPSRLTQDRIQESQKQMNTQYELRKTHRKSNPIGIGADTQIYHEGYTILHFLLSLYHEKDSKTRKLVELSIKAFSFLRGLLPLIYGLAITAGTNGLGMYWNEYIINLLTSYQVFNLFSAICLQIAFGLLDLRRKLIILEELTYMLIPRKIGVTGASKVLPTINIIKKESLKGWSILRKSIMQYGKSFMNRVESLIAVMTVYAMVCIVLCILTYFHVLDLSTVLIIEFCFDITLFIAMLFMMLLWGASLNQTFSDQIKNLHNNKIFIQDLLLVSNSYIYEGKISNNFLYNKGLQIVQQNLEEDQSVEEYLHDLLEYYDQIIDELRYDEQNYPYTLFGIKVTSIMLKSLFVTLASVGASVLASYLTKELNTLQTDTVKL